MTVDEKLDAILVKLDAIDKKIDCNYDKLSEFYVTQKDHNTSVEDRIDFLAEKVGVFADQTIKNTVALKKYKAV